MSLMDRDYMRRYGGEDELVDALVDEMTVNPDFRCRYRSNPGGYLSGIGLDLADPRRDDLLKLAAWPDEQLQAMLEARGVGAGR